MNQIRTVITCIYGCSGLRILCDCLPASLASITSYLSAEVTRGVWKSVSMNGTDWPSPDANLSNFVEGMKKIVAFAGLDVPSVTSGSFYHYILLHVCLCASGPKTAIVHIEPSYFQLNFATLNHLCPFDPRMFYMSAVHV